MFSVVTLAARVPAAEGASRKPDAGLCNRRRPTVCCFCAAFQPRAATGFHDPRGHNLEASQSE